jgi:hypothetical protein
MAPRILRERRYGLFAGLAFVKVSAGRVDNFDNFVAGKTLATVSGVALI